MVLLGLLGIFRIRVETSPVEYFREDTPIRQRFHDIYRDLAGSFPINVVIDTKKDGYFEAPDHLKEIRDLQAFLGTLDGGDKTISFADYLIFGIMFLLFLSIKVGLIALLANGSPIVVNFGLMGWLGIELSVIIGLGFSVLMLSHFEPTAVFGLMMVVTLVSALMGDLILLPSLMTRVELVTLWGLLITHTTITMGALIMGRIRALLSKHASGGGKEILVSKAGLGMVGLEGNSGQTPTQWVEAALTKARTSAAFMVDFKAGNGSPVDYQ